ncbi:MAG: photosystem II biogenesis protein Psp29 [Leptolyngbyaceae cyanobacterium RU_5_1]|nr:photosystem II biogenesis protein Psp29 [Leptolyngbyaceae cyanobacterium RU_5_1]
MNNVRTVSDTKRAFYTAHTRPINSIYRRVVEELMVEMHLLAVNVDYHYDPIYALGIVTSFSRFMQGYRPEQDKNSIFDGICGALQDNPQRYRQDAERLRAFVSQKSAPDLVLWLEQAATMPAGDELQQQIKAIANNLKFKYSRLFAIGLFSMLELADPELVKDETRRGEALEKISVTLRLPYDKIQKDLELYRSNLEKMAQAQAVMEDLLKAEKKKREQQMQLNNGTSPTDSTATPKDEAPSGS